MSPPKGKVTQPPEKRRVAKANTPAAAMTVAGTASHLAGALMRAAGNSAVSQLINRPPGAAVQPSGSGRPPPVSDRDLGQLRLLQQIANARNDSVNEAGFVELLKRDQIYDAYQQLFPVTATNATAPNAITLPLPDIDVTNYPKPASMSANGQSDYKEVPMADKFQIQRNPFSEESIVSDLESYKSISLLQLPFVIPYSVTGQDVKPYLRTVGPVVEAALAFGGGLPGSSPGSSENAKFEETQHGAAIDPVNVRPAPGPDTDVQTAKAPIQNTPNPAPPALTGTSLQPPRVAPSEQSFADAAFDAVIREVRNSTLGQRLEAAKRRPDPALAVDTVRTRAQVDALAHAQARANAPPGRAPGTQIQHQTKTLDVTRNLPAGMDPLAAEVINENIFHMQSRASLPSTLLHIDPHGGGTRFYIGNEPAGRTAYTGLTGEQLDASTPPPATINPSYQTEHKFADNFLIPEVAQQIAEARAKASLLPMDPRVLAISAGEQSRWMLTGAPGSSRTGRLVDLAANASARPAAPPSASASAQQMVQAVIRKLLQ